MGGLLSTHPLGTSLLTADPQLTPVRGADRSGKSYASQITLGTPGKCPNKPTLLISLFDNSGSITGGNDPIGQRFTEVGLAIARVGSRCRCGKDLVASIHFDVPTSADLDATPITKPNHDAIAASLRIPPDGAGISMLGPSIMAAYKVAQHYKDSHRIVLAALTDYELFDDYLDDLIRFPGDVHAVVLRSRAPQRLVEAETVSVTEIDYSSPPGTLARSIFGALVETRPGAKPLAPSQI